MHVDEGDGEGDGGERGETSSFSLHCLEAYIYSLANDSSEVCSDVVIYQVYPYGLDMR